MKGGGDDGDDDGGGAAEMVVDGAGVVERALIRLQRIYNFGLFHAIILSILDALYAILYHFWELTY